MWSFPKMRLVPDGFCKADKCSCKPSIMQNLLKFAFLKTVARLMVLLFWVSSGIGNGPKKRVRSGAPMIPDWLGISFIYLQSSRSQHQRFVGSFLGQASQANASWSCRTTCYFRRTVSRLCLRKPFRNRMVRNEVFSCGLPKFNSNIILGSKVPISWHDIFSATSNCV